MSSGIENYKPILAMICLQLMYSGVSLITRYAIVEGLNPLVFVVYRHAVAALVMAPLAYSSRRRDQNKASLGLKGLGWIFLISLFGVTGNQICYFEGLYFASSTAAGAMSNVTPAATFLIATIFGLEKVEIRIVRSVAKVVGTAICISGAMCMTFVKGPNLLNHVHQLLLSDLHMMLTQGDGGDNWPLGCLFLFGNSCCWAVMNILQVPVNANCPDKLYSSTLIALLATLNSAVIVLFMERDTSAWKLNSLLDVGCCLFGGMSQAISFFGQAWCISKRGPLFSAMFNPLNTVITTILAAIFLHERTYTGSLLGAIIVIMGLYIVLWGKAKDIEESSSMRNEVGTKSVKSLIKDTINEVDLEQPFLSQNPADLNVDMSTRDS